MEKITKLVSSIFDEGMEFPDVLQSKIDAHDEKFISMMKEMLTYIYTEKMPFNKFLGIEMISIELDEIVLKFPLRPELIGNYDKQILHGGVISAVIDLAGGIAIQIAALKNLDGLNILNLQKRLAAMSTIDMRIDFLRPGKGECFFVKSSVVKAGKNVSVARSSFYDKNDRELAIGTASYKVGN